MLDASDDRKKYVQELVRRIAYKPLFSSVIFDFKPFPEKVVISAEQMFPLTWSLLRLNPWPQAEKNISAFKLKFREVRRFCICQLQKINCRSD